MRYLFLDASSPLAFGQAGDESHHQPFTWSTQMNLAARLTGMIDEMQAALATWEKIATQGEGGGARRLDACPVALPPAAPPGEGLVGPAGGGTLGEVGLAGGEAGPAGGEAGPAGDGTENVVCPSSVLQRDRDTPSGPGFRLGAGDRLGVCTGPGSLTGLRVALSFFRALALVRELPLIGLDLFTWGARTLETRGVRGPVRLLAPAFLGQAFLVDLELPLRTGCLAIPDRLESGKTGTDAADSPRVSDPSGSGRSPPSAPALGPRSGAPDGRPTFGLRFAAEGVARLDPEPAVLHDLMLRAPAPAGWEALLRVAPLYVVPSQAELKWAQTHDHPGH